MTKARPFKELISLETARQRMFEVIKPVTETEKIFISEAQNRIIAQPLEARIDVPSFDRSAMDGYAVIAEDTYSSSDLDPKTLKSIGSIYAGSIPTFEVRGGECVYIATGAMMPKGADSVVMVEYTEDQGDRILIRRPVHPGENVSRKGNDICSGTIPLENGQELTPSRIGAVAALGIQDIDVYVKPKVAIIGTGNEVCPLGQELQQGQVYDINTYTLASVVIGAGGEPTVLGLVKDTLDDLDDIFNTAINQADMVVFSGGSSVGERDLLIDVFSKQGKVLFHGVQLKPGKPVLAALIKGHLCFGFPGYPTSCLTSALLFLGPAVRKMARKPQLWPNPIKAILGRRITSTLGRTQVLTVKLNNGVAQPAFKESGAITSMCNADGYIIIPSNIDMLEKDDEVDVFLL